MKKLILIMFLAIGITAQSQGKLSLDVYFDAKLLIVGDDKGNESGTLDILLKLEMQGNQFKEGYIYVFPQFEYVNLKGGQYMRYGGGVGYTFNRFFEKIEISPSANFGLITRPDITVFSLEFGGDISYRINKRIKLSVLATYTERKDLYFLWDIKNEWRFNGYVGIKYILN